MCQSSLFNDTPSEKAYCSCRGQWGGLRCELRLFVTVQFVASQVVALKLRGRSSDGHKKAHTTDNLFVSEVTVAVWNFNVSDQCLLLQQNMSAKNVIILNGLDKEQEYLVCIANGFMDSCLFFQQQLLNISKLSTCIYFETKQFDVESLDIGFIAVPSGVVIFIIVIIIFLYCQRHSLFVQLCLNKVCCRNCYCIRKRIQRRQCLTHRHRDVSGDMLMPGDVSMDFESISEAHTRATGESNCRRTHSSNASSTSRRSACSIDPDGSMTIPASMDHNTFLYENQSLIPPLYSPQDHKVMTLTYIDDDFIPVNTEYTASEPKDALFSEPQSGGFPQDQIHEERTFTDDNPGCDILKDEFVIPGSDVQKCPHIQIPDSILFQEAPGSCQYTGPLKQQLFVHPYLHRPYHKNHILHGPNHLTQPFSQPSHNEHSVRFREPNSSAHRQRPFSMPATHISQDPSGIEKLQFSNHAKHYIKSPRKSSLRNTEGNSLLLPSAWPAKYNRNNFIRSNSDTNYLMANHLLFNPTRHKPAMDVDDQSSAPATCYNSSNENCSSNTLPRSKKPQFVNSFPRNSIEDSLLNSSFGDHQKNLIVSPPKRPTWLNISNPIQNPNPLTLSQEVKVASTDLSTSSESKSHSKHARSLKSHFEHNLSFLKSKSNRPTDEEKEYQDLLSPLAAERIKASKKSRHSNAHKSSSGNKTASSTEPHKPAATFGQPVFEGHPSEHVIPPFATDNQEDEEDVSDTSLRNDASERNSIASNFSKSGDSVISSYEGDDTNLVTPFDADNSSDDDTYKDIQSLTGSTETLHDLEVEQFLLNADGTSHSEHQLLQNRSQLNVQSEESEKLLDF